MSLISCWLMLLLTRCVSGEAEMPLQEALDDVFRVNYFASYVEQMALARNHDGVDMRGYCAWSLLDNFEVF